MPKKTVRKIEEEKATEPSVSETDEQLTESVKAEVFEPKEEKPKVKKPSDTVKVKVLIGTLEFEAGVFSKGDIFETSRKRAERFEKTSVEILE